MNIVWPAKKKIKWPARGKKIKWPAKKKKFRWPAKKKKMQLADGVVSERRGKKN